MLACLFLSLGAQMSAGDVLPAVHLRHRPVYVLPVSGVRWIRQTASSRRDEAAAEGARLIMEAADEVSWAVDR